MGALGTAVIYYVAGGAGVSVADYMSFNVAFGMMTTAVTSVANMASQMARVGPMYEMVRPILETAPEVDDDKPVAGELTGGIEVSGITFRYSDESPYVMQDGRLFSGDIASNITISMPTATQDDAWEAAEIAGIADDIRKMPMGMQTRISEGSGGISGGQRQHIMIARAVCGNRKIIILDGGRIAEEGTDDELMDQDGIFAELVARQRLDGE